MSHRFVANGAFTLVERAELEKLLSEQRFQASGAVDNETAVKLGKVVGAGVLLLGNIQKMGGKYNINARLVNAETGEIIVSGYGELVSGVFEEDARPYLNIVPEVQRLGFYLLYNYRHNANSLSSQYSNVGNTLTLTPRAFDLGLFGGGVRYFPSSKIVVDLSGFGNGSKPIGGNLKIPPGINMDYNVKVYAFRGLVNLKTRWTDRVTSYSGVGLTRYKIYAIDPVAYITPTVMFRLEYSPQPRIGISISGGYDLKTQSAKGSATTGLVDSDIYGTTEKARLDKFYLEPSVSVYF
jgi:hypothetical protein